MIGLIGGIAGGVIGLLGGVVGTYASYQRANGPRERAFVIRAAVLCWLAVSTFLAGLFLMPMPWRFLLWAVYGPFLFFFIRWMNQGQARARAVDLGDAQE